MPAHAPAFGLTDDQGELQARARALACEVVAPRAAEIDRTEAYPWHSVRALLDAGFMGMTIPREYGGAGAGHLDAVIVVEAFAASCGATARIVVESNMGAIGAIMSYGSEAQKRLAADLVLAGDKPAICITEPDAGSAASELTTRADKRGDSYVINGAKHWITGGGVSRLHLIFARVFADGEEQGIAGFIAVRPESEGLRVGRRAPAMGIRGLPETEIILDDLEVSGDMMVVPPGGVRRGFAGLMDAYNAQRVGAAAVALGIAKGAYELALRYAQERRQFGRAICEFQGIQWMLADMSIQIAAAEALVYKAAAGAGDAFPDVLEASRAKILAAETAIRVTNDALQIHGAVGYSREQPLERMVRDARMFTISGGTTQILRTLVASRILERKLPQRSDGHVL